MDKLKFRFSDTHSRLPLLSARKAGSGFTLRMAPMIDVVFLLLIFFLITSDFRTKEQFLPCTLAASSAVGFGTNPIEPLVINIRQTGEDCIVHIQGAEPAKLSSAAIENDLTVLMNTLSSVYQKHKRNAADPVEFICSDDLQWDYLAKIYNCFYGFGITDITFNLSSQL